VDAHGLAGDAEPRGRLVERGTIVQAQRGDRPQPRRQVDRAIDEGEQRPGVRAIRSNDRRRDLLVELMLAEGGAANAGCMRSPWHGAAARARPHEREERRDLTAPQAAGGARLAGCRWPLRSPATPGSRCR
jgi:hypothetical protein